MAEAHSAIRSSYDDVADVLYISVGPKERTRAREDDYGIVWRTNIDGHVVGATIQAFGRWEPETRELVQILADRLHLSSNVISGLLSSARH